MYKQPMSKPKVVIIGAGSLFFGRQAIWAMNHLPGLREGTLALVDTNPANLERMEKLARMVAKSVGSNLTIEAHAEYRAALPGADYVVLSFSERNAHFRRIDCEISARYGIRMCSGDTIGPGGVFRTLREFPKILEMAHAVEELAPQAWVINYVNPSAIMGIGLMRYSDVKTFALCDSHHMPFKKRGYLKMLGEPEEAIDEFDMRIAGVNHFTWMLKAELRGEDVLPRIRDVFFEKGKKEKDVGYSKGRFNAFITAQLTDVFGAIPTCTGHTKEYLPFYQGRAAIQEAIPPLPVFDCDEREARTAEMWEAIDSYLDGSKPISEFNEKTKSDHATDIIHTMVVEDGRTYFINRANSECTAGGRAVGNLPDDAFLELECRLDRNGPKPLPVADFPFGLRALQMLVLDVHELTIEAIVKQDRSLLVRALGIDPLVNSIATAEAVIDDLYAAQADVLGDWVVAAKTNRVSSASATTGETPQLY